MLNIKEITVFTIGDSAKISTWSNVPFFFTEHLLKKGIKVNRVDIKPIHIIERIYNKTVYKVLKFINPDSSYEYFRSFINYVTVKYRVKKALKEYKNSGANIFLTFSFSAAGLTKKPVVLFCDWTYDHYFAYFKNRKPDFWERKSLERENRAIEKSDLVISLFPGVYSYMGERYLNKNIFYLGNVINSLEFPAADIIPLKHNLNNILFIGSRKYMEGAKILIEAFGRIREEYPGSTLHMVGLDKSDFDNLPDDIKFYGYLDKGKKNERELYYKLLREAKIFINTTPKWGAFSATIEAMYFYNPVIVAPYNDFIKTFGENINFGGYCLDNNAELLAARIKEIFNNSRYESLCINAHEAVKDFTWDNYIDNLLDCIKKRL